MVKNFILLTGLCFILSCSLMGNEQIRPQAPQAPSSPVATADPQAPTSTETNFENVQYYVLQKNCNECHRAGERGKDFIFDTEDQFKKLVDKIEDSVYIEQSMPPRRALQLSEFQLTLLKSYIDIVKTSSAENSDLE